MEGSATTNPPAIDVGSVAPLGPVDAVGSAGLDADAVARRRAVLGSAEGGAVPMADRAHRHRAHASDRGVEASEGLRDRIQSLAVSIHAAEAELVELLVELDDADGWTGAGIRSLSHWLTLNSAYTTSEANQRARLAQRRGELPSLFAAFDAGALSVGAVHTAQRVATVDNDAEVTDIATHRATAPQAATTFAAFARADANDRARRDAAAEQEPPESAPGADDPDAADPTDPGVWLRTWWEANGHLRIDGRLDATDGATLSTLLDRLRDWTPAADGSADAASTTDAAASSDLGGGAGDIGARDGVRPPRWATRPEAFSQLLRLAGDALTHSGVAGRWTDRFAITVTIDVDALLGNTSGRGTLADGTSIPGPIVASWAGAGWLQGLLTERRRPLYQGRRTRIATPEQRRALLAHDGGCAFPGCSATHHLTAHHVREWRDFGATDIDNLVLLCRRHHRLLHDGEYSITMDDGWPTVHSSAVIPLRRRPPPTDLTRRRRTHPDPTRRAEPTADPARRCCEPLTHHALDVFVSTLLGRRQTDAA